MEFLLTLVAGIILTTFIVQYFDFRKTKIRALSDEEHQVELSDVLRELASMREMMADMVLTLDQDRLPPRLSESRDDEHAGSGDDDAA
jgi:hypothetical protein